MGNAVTAPDRILDLERPEPGKVEDDVQPGIRAMTLISKSKPASQLTPTAVQFG